MHSTQSDLYEDLGVRSANERERKFLARTIHVTCRAYGTSTNLDREVAMIDIEWSSCISCCAGSIDVSGGCQADMRLLPCTRRGESLRWQRKRLSCLSENELGFPPWRWPAK